ncbi:hypothetical protein [Nocardia sp. NPDC058497]|uniref:hypothetical protein n=1 Tax=Nocardia sp. NPDC058497 TaxID=3346529 RepID=UPI003646DAFA
MTATAISGTWRELLGPKYLTASIVLAGGVGLYATNEFLTGAGPPRRSTPFSWSVAPSARAWPGWW